jgi:hypothetical protein
MTTATGSTSLGRPQDGRDIFGESRQILIDYDNDGKADIFVARATPKRPVPQRG